MENKILLLIFFIKSITLSEAQFLNKRILTGHGLSFATDYYSIQKRIDSNTYSTYGWSPLTYTFNTRVILNEVDNNSSISLDIPLTIGSGISNKGFGSFSIPLMLGMSIGNISTSTSDKDKGMVLGLGVEYVYASIFRKAGSLSGYKNSWFEPCMNVGYRYWNRRNKAREFNLKIGYNPGQLVKTSKEEMGNTKSFSIRLAYILYHKY